MIEDIVREGPPSGRDFRVAEGLVRLMLELKELDDVAVYKFAEAKKFDEVMVSLAVLNDVPAEMMARLRAASSLVSSASAPSASR